MGNQKGVVDNWRGACAVNVGPGGTVYISDGNAVFDGIDCWPMPTMVGLPLTVPDDGQWYTVSLCIDQHYIATPRMLPGLAWDYDSDKISLAAVRRWPGGDVQIEDRREYLKCAPIAVG